MFATLNPEQQAAVDHRGGPLLVVAGAGTGKTRTLVARVASILSDGVDPSRVMLLTFTRRAAAEMLSRVAAASPGRATAEVWGGTFHSVGNRLLRRHHHAAGLTSDFTVLDSADSADLLGLVRSELGFDTTERRFPRKETILGIYTRMVNSQTRLETVLESDYPWCSGHADPLRSIFTEYTRRKRAYQVLDFDDLLLFWRGLLAGTGEGTAGDHLRSSLDHVLVDEYQDTNPIQADIVAGLCRPDTELCVVGDDAQAIYGFRSATVANMWTFTERFESATKVTLEQNYRSTTPILAVANGVLDQSRTQHRKTLWTRRHGGRRPTLLTHHDEGAQSAEVAEMVLDARDRGIDLRDQAVLFRAGHHSDGLELELTRRDIPFVKYGGLKYLETAHVKDLLALLRILDNPSDRLAWSRALNMVEGIGPATVRRLGDELDLDDGVTALARFVEGAGTVPAAARDQTDELRSALAACMGSAGAAPADDMARLQHFCAVVFPRRYDDADARLADIDRLAATAAGYRSRSRFLVEVTLDPPGRTSDLAGPPHLDDDWLTLSTIHSAKGLEWPIVHLIHAADGNIPSEMASGDDDGLAEELRLAYVALTRARDELSVHFPLRFHVNRFASDDRHVYAQMSRFLDPVRDLFVERTTGVGPDSATVPLTATVDLADEVDTALSALWG